MNSSSPLQPPRRSWPRRMLNRLEVDQAVFFAIVLRGWQLLAGPIVLMLVAVYFSPEAQGYYFTFASLLSMQTFVELGLRSVVLHLSSHEWALLKHEENGRVSGDPVALSRLGGLARRMLAWYAGAGIVFLVTVGGAGLMFFHDRAVHVEWRAPWMALVGITAGQLLFVPLVALLEGCGQIRAVNQFRLIQAVLVSIAACVAIPAGALLWTAVVIAAVRCGCDLVLTVGRFGPFFRSLIAAAVVARVQWRQEIWPLQWRLALQCLVAWFAFSLLNPVIFHYHGAAEAGRMGLTWSALTALQAAAMAWVETRAPLFGTLIARRDFRELDRVFFRVTQVGTTMQILGMVMFLAGLFALQASQLSLADLSRTFGLTSLLPGSTQPLSDRLLAFPATAFLAAGLTIQSLALCLALYLRAHKRDPLLASAMLSYACVGLLVWGMGRSYGSLGAAAGYCLAHGVILLPTWFIVWRRSRREWHTVD